MRKNSKGFIFTGAVLVILLIGLQTTILFQNSGLEQNRHSDYTAFISSTAKVPRTSAILLHGWRCSASMMAPMARALAKAGIPAFTLELPGHGRSQMPFGIECPAGGGICRPDSSNTIEVISTIKKLILAEKLSDQQIFLIGHSSGGGRGQEVLQAAELSAYKLKLINLDGRLNLDTLPDDRIFSVFIENSQAFTEKSANVLTKISHLSLISSDDIFQKIIQKIGGPEGTNASASWLPKAATLILLLLLFWSLNFFVPEAKWSPTKKGPSAKNLVFCFLIAASVAGMFAFGLNTRIHYQFQILTAARNATDYYLMLTGMLFLVYLTFTGEFKIPKITWPEFKKTCGFVFLGFLPLSLIVFPFMDHYYLHTSLTGYRLPGFLLLSIGFLPLAISVSILGRDYTLRAACWLGLLVIFLLFFHPAKIISDAGEIFLGLLLLELYVTRFENRTGSWAASRLLMALILGWLVTVLYPVFAVI